jgi:hypothetical protein
MDSWFRTGTLDPCSGTNLTAGCDPLSYRKKLTDSLAALFGGQSLPSPREKIA